MEKHPTLLNYNSNDNNKKNLDQVNSEIAMLTKIRKELRLLQNKILRDNNFSENLEKFKHFI
tara:strand:- start:1601 stop:1786 length:186 start_codon:yes stop_codon:yes gene_type:complete